MLLYITTTLNIIMFKCPYTSCDAIYQGDEIFANLSFFNRGVCPKCAKQVDINFDLGDYTSKVEPEPELEEVEESVDLNEFTVAELKEELTELGLSIKGKKTTLIKRLEEFLEDNDE